MLGRVWLKNASNGRVAWVLAASALGAILALPTPASAQVDKPSGSTKGPDQNRPTPFGAGQQPSAPQRTRTDILDLRDAASANTMVVAQPPAPAGSEPLTANAVICLAGCDRGPGTIVYRDRPMPTLASLGTPQPIPSPPAPAGKSNQSGDAVALNSVVTCLAGCYEPPPARTIASLRTQTAKAAPQPLRAARSIVAAPIATEEPTTPAAQTSVDAAPAPTKPVKLRTGFAADGTRKTVRNARGKMRTRTAVKRGPEYGKIVVVPPEKLKAVSAPASSPAPQAVAASSEPATAPATPVTTFTPPPKTEKAERKKVEKAKPLATVSNDWFNKINRQRKEDEAAKQKQQQ